MRVSSPTLVVPKKLSTCPRKMITAMPLVNPVMTGAGMKETTTPNRSSPATSRMAPLMKPAMKTPCIPYWAESPARIAVMAPVGPEIWYEAPESDPMRSPAIMAVMRPAAASAPELTPKARANGRATAATVRPASRSLEQEEAL